MTRPYRPSNGTEGESFMDAYCAHCKHETEDKPCHILGASLAFQIGHPSYPKEWIEEDDGSKPRCTAFQMIGAEEPCFACKGTGVAIGKDVECGRCEGLGYLETPIRCEKTEDMFS
jgi:hypothetical protein